MAGGLISPKLILVMVAQAVAVMVGPLVNLVEQTLVEVVAVAEVVLWGVMEVQVLSSLNAISKVRHE